VSSATIGRVLAEAHARPYKVRGWLNWAEDPGFWARAGAVCLLCLDPPSGTVLVSVDEKTGTQVKTRIRPRIPARPGRDARREFECRQELPRRGDFASREDLENQIAEFTIQHNKTARPYKWSYDVDAEHAATSNATPARTPSPGPHDRNNP
jgi:hypothetical protein